jgi:CubicO group peptidase (beta-lactamase class C family)
MEALGLVENWPVDAVAVGVIRLSDDDPGSATVLGGGFESIGDADHCFAWASVTKPATALAVLIAAEEGTLALDSPVGPTGSTVRHVLAHASGLGFETGPKLARPGTRRIYSNIGFRMLADLIVRQSGLSFVDYMSEGVLSPLDMSGAVLDPPGPEGAAAGLHGSLRDLMALAAEWMRPTLVSAETHRLATTVNFPGLAGVLPGFGGFDPCDWGLGVEIRGHKRPHWTGHHNSPATFGHFGRSGSFLWMDPVANVACGALSDRPFGPWAAEAWPILADAVLTEIYPTRPDASV